MHWKLKGTHGIAHETSLELETETETKYKAISRLETETETLEMPETRPRRESRLVSVREMVKTESLAHPWFITQTTLWRDVGRGNNTEHGALASTLSSNT